MANREQRGNRETRKPKKDKAAKPVSGAAASSSKAQPQAWKQKTPKA
jgi:hypothetical protein